MINVRVSQRSPDGMRAPLILLMRIRVNFHQKSFADHNLTPVLENQAASHALHLTMDWVKATFTR